MTKGDGSYRDDLIDALRTQDLEVFRRFVAKHEKIRGLGLPTDDSMWELARHLMMINAPELPDLQQESQEWLALSGKAPGKEKENGKRRNQVPIHRAVGRKQASSIRRTPMPTESQNGYRPGRFAGLPSHLVDRKRGNAK